MAALKQEPPSLQVIDWSIRDHHGVYELRIAPDGRATFAFGSPVRGSEAHIIWRRIGAHEVLERP